MTRHDVYRYIVNLLYPNVCPCCERVIDYNDAFCEDCMAEITRYRGDFSVKHADKFIAFCEYNEHISGAILKYKHECEGNAYYAFACGIMKALEENGLTDSIDAVLAVPVTKNVRKRRGYNQSELIAEELRHMLKKPHIKAVDKIRATAQQKHLSGSERRENLLGAFAVTDKASVDGKCILVIDDVCTTGSTLSEIAKILKENGAKGVIAASFAKTAKRDRKTSELQEWEKEPI